jgi:hypothetical protein
VSITHQFTARAGSQPLPPASDACAAAGAGMDECVDMWAPLVLLGWSLAVAHEQRLLCTRRAARTRHRSRVSPCACGI